MERLRFLHIPKTAGSSFTQNLLFQYAGEEHFKFKGNITSDTMRYMSLPASKRQNIKLFTGHAPIITGIEEVDEVKIITFLRHPVARVKSFIQHISEGKSPEYLTDSFDLDKFLESGFPDLSNLQTQMLINKGNSVSLLSIGAMSKAEARDTALYNLFNIISMYGLQEYFDESLMLFAKSLNWSTPFYKSLNAKNPHRLIEFKQHHLDQIAEMNTIDIDMYAAARARFMKLLEDPNFDGSKLKRFKTINSVISKREGIWRLWKALNRNRRWR